MTRDCPSCGSGRVRLDGGCPSCMSCGWSRCTPIRADGGQVQGEAPLWERDEDRFVAKRTSYLHRAAGIESKKAEALAYSELGYSAAGIAYNIDVTAGTVAAWLEDLEELLGLEAVLVKRPDELGVSAGYGAEEVAVDV